MGSENNADQAWALVSSWLWDGAESALVAWALDIRRAIIRRFRHPDNPGAAMQNTQILSTQPPLPDSGPPERSARSVRAAAGAGPGGQPPRGRALVFDACQVGVVLRAVLFVELVVGVGAMYGAGNPVEWLATLALLTGGALPATLLWLVTACSLKTVLQRLTTVQQYLAGVLLGALAGAYACGMLALVAQPTSAPWLASAATGALLAAMLVAALVLRARGPGHRRGALWQTPAGAVEPGPPHRRRPPAPAAAAAPGGERRQTRRGAQRPGGQAPRAGRSTAPPARRSSGNPGNRHGSRAAPLQRRMVDSPNDNNSPLRDHEHPDR